MTNENEKNGSPNHEADKLLEISKWKKFLYAGGVSKKTILFFTKNLSIMLKAGSTLSESLAVMKGQAKGKFLIILTDICNDVSKGMKFSEALSRYNKIFSDIYINIVRTGEESGNLEKNLEYLSHQLQKNAELKKKIISAMIYPMVVFGGTVALGIGIVFFVLPQISKLFKSFTVELPATTRFMLKLGDIAQTLGIWGLFLVIAMITFGLWFLRRKFLRPVTHFMILHIPIVRTLSQNLNLAFFYRNLSILLSSGVTIDESILICSKTVTNYHYKKFLERAHKKIKEGSNLSSILKEKKGFFPDTDLQIVTVGENSGTLSETLSYSADIHEESVDNITKNLSDILEPILLIFLGIMVGTLALSIITPIYSVTQQFK